jgi:hypothetical protein
VILFFYIADQFFYSIIALCAFVICVSGQVVRTQGQRPTLFSESDYYERDESYQAWISKVLRPVEELGPVVLKYGQYSAQYNASVLVIEQGFQPDIVLNIGGSTFVGIPAVIGSLTQPGSLPHPNPTPVPEVISVSVPNGNGQCGTRTVSMRCDFVPAYGTVLVGSGNTSSIAYTPQVLQRQLITMTQKCSHNVYDPYYKLQTLDVTNFPLV